MCFNPNSHDSVVGEAVEAAKRFLVEAMSDTPAVIVVLRGHDLAHCVLLNGDELNLREQKILMTRSFHRGIQGSHDGGEDAVTDLRFRDGSGYVRCGDLVVAYSGDACMYDMACITMFFTINLDLANLLLRI